MGFFPHLFLAVGLDVLVGDPHYPLHPVRLIGRLITVLEGLFSGRMRNQLLAGVWLGGSTVLISALAAGYLADLHPLVSVYLIYVALAPRSLMDAVVGIREALEKGDLASARSRLSRVVGRDTTSLSPKEIVQASVETVAENTADGVIVPLFYLLLGVPWGLSIPLVWIFKAVDTLDSMVGYRDSHYKYLGRFSARLDDIFCFLPARLTGLLLVAAAYLGGYDGRQAGYILARDHDHHDSPNSGWCEGAMAGALGIQLGGGAYYGGLWVERPLLGEPGRLPTAADISKATDLMWTSYALLLLLGILLLRRWM